jgi:drug/metabolite transporter (DMT)-like permease
MMLVVSILYSITGSMIKVGINNSSPLFYGAVYFVIFSFAYAPIGLRNIRTTSSHVMQGKRIPWMLLIAGGLMFISLVTHMVSVSMTEVAYMVSVKRSSLLFGVLMGYMFFKETNIRQRFLGTFLMLLGFILIVQSAS